MAEAFQYTASATGTLTRLTIYLDSSNTATNVVVGLYTDTGSNNPGTLLTQGTISAPVKGAWNSLTVPSVSVTTGTKYWIAVLGPTGAGAAQFRDVASGSNTQTSAATNLAVLPSTWATGQKFTNSPMSAYASTN
jgi:hypothetical protein